MYRRTRIGGLAAFVLRPCGIHLVPGVCNNKHKSWWSDARARRRPLDENFIRALYRGGFLKLDPRRTTLSRGRLAASATALATACAAAGLVAGAWAGQPRAIFTAASGRVDNPWFPLRPGTTYIYPGVKDGERGRDLLTGKHRTP